MNYCKKCGDPAPEGHDQCWMCEHDRKLTAPRSDEHCTDDACPLDTDKEKQEG